MNQSPVIPFTAVAPAHFLGVVLAMFGIFLAVLLWSRRQPPGPARTPRALSDDEPQDTLPGTAADALEELHRRSGDGS